MILQLSRTDEETPLTISGTGRDPVVQNAQRARHALERVCAGAIEEAGQYYSPSFVDHVNGREYHGLAGVERSVASYRKLFDSMSIAVEEQHVAGDYVTSRFVVTGVIRGRTVRFHGITISRVEESLIVEDWSVIDTLGMLRQLGLTRLVITIVRSLLPGRTGRAPKAR